MSSYEVEVQEIPGTCERQEWVGVKKGFREDVRLSQEPTEVQTVAYTPLSPRTQSQRPTGPIVLQRPGLNCADIKTWTCYGSKCGNLYIF